MKCANCETELLPHSRFCSHCGTKVSRENENKCSACGTTLKPGARFCQHCGEAVAGPSASSIASDLDREILQPEANVQRPLWMTLLPLLGSVAVVGILFLLFYPRSNPQPAAMPASGGQTAQSNEDEFDMAAMAPVFRQIDSLKNAVTQNPKDIGALTHLAALYDMAGKYDQASSYYQDILKITPENIEARMNLAGAYFNLGQREQALAELHMVLKYRPNYDYAMYNLGVIYAAIAKPDEAREWWNKVTTGSPTSDLARRAMEGMKRLNE
ncbi:MAG: tetratricopeptide repeat protein [bacterium]